MAKAESILVNHNIYTKDTKAVDEFIKHHLFENNLIKNRKKLLSRATERIIDERYDYRPDRLAYEIYGEDFYYPAILVANNIGSILQFKADILDNKCWIPFVSDIRDLIGLPEMKKLQVGEIVDKIFEEPMITKN